MTAIPRPRTAPELHDCDACVDCPGCNGGRRRLPDVIRPVIHDNGWIEARCDTCDGRLYLCPTQPRTPPWSHV